jgi:hypothetical protein
MYSRAEPRCAACGPLVDKGMMCVLGFSAPGGKDPAPMPDGSLSQPDATPKAILQALEAQNALSTADARAHARHFWCVPATLEIQSSRTAPVRQTRVATNNISEGGFAFIIDARLAVGTIVRTTFETLPDKPRINGVVRSCVYLCGTQHRIGVEFAPS